MQLTNVVLPAPLGPMTPRISPWRIVRSTSETAARPPKRLVMPRASRMGGPVPVPEDGKRETGNEGVWPDDPVSLIPLCTLGFPISAFRFPSSRQPARAHVGQKHVPSDPPALRDPAEQIGQSARQEDDEEDDDGSQNGRMQL